MADTMLSFKDNNLSTNFLSMDDVKKLCPHAFHTAPTNPDVSDRYIHANTATVIEDLSKLGWYPTDAKQCRPKKGSSGIRSFHMISFQNPDVKITKEIKNIDGDVTEIVDSYPRIILTNSHDGFNSFKFMLGLFRLVCENGLIVCDNQMINMSIRHMNYTFEMLREIGTCKGVENYSRILSRRAPGSTPFTLLDYFPKDFIMFIDESHVTLPQVRGMFGGDKSRKDSLIEFGFRLPSAYDNRPLNFDEFYNHINQAIHKPHSPSPQNYKFLVAWLDPPTMPDNAM
mgnify:CR=1 FL=1